MCDLRRIMYDADLFCVLVRDSGQFHPPSPFFEDASVSTSNTLARMVGGGSKQRRGRYTTQQRQLAMTTVIDFSATALIPPGARGGQGDKTL
jgi:hypothetical protein